MIRKLLTIVCLIFLCLNFSTANLSAHNGKPDDEAGYALLEELVVGFRDMAEKGTGGYKEVNPLIQKIMAGLKKAKEQGQVDSVFYKRFHRMLVVMKLTIMEKSYDPEGILDPLISRELEEFVDDMCGDVESMKSLEKRGVGVIAGALTEEIFRLHMYLDYKKKKPQLMEKIIKQHQKKKELKNKL